MSRRPQTCAESRVPPHSRDAEEAVLGAVLIDNHMLPIVESKIADPSMFYDLSRAKIYTAMLALSDASIPIDMITLSSALEEAGELESVGGHAALSRLIDMVPTSARAEHYANVVRETASIRRVIHVAQEIAAEGYERRLDGESFIDRAERLLGEAVRDRATEPYEHISTVSSRVLDAIEAASSSGRDVTGLETGFFDLDRITCGLQQTDLIVVAGRPSMGKTSLALNIARIVAGNGNEVLVVSLEQGREQLVQRLIASEARVDFGNMRSGLLTLDCKAKVFDGGQVVGNLPITIDDRARTVYEVKSKARRKQLEGGLDLLVVDYLQLMSPGRRNRNDSREREIAEISRAMKLLAIELGIPVLLLSQLNRSLEHRQDKRPTLADLRDSGAVEQDADVVVFVYRDEVYNANTPDIGIAELIVGKQRNGPIGTVRLRFVGELFSFYNLSRQT